MSTWVVEASIQVGTISPSDIDVSAVMQLTLLGTCSVLAFNANEIRTLDRPIFFTGIQTLVPQRKMEMIDLIILLIGDM